MVWDVLMQFLSWAVPGGLGAGATWFLSRRQRRIREGKIPGTLTPERVRALDAIGMVW